MMRHVHSLRSHVVSMLLSVVNTLVMIGGKQVQADKATASAKKSQVASAVSAQPMETDIDERATASSRDAAGPTTSGSCQMLKEKRCGMLHSILLLLFLRRNFIVADWMGMNGRSPQAANKLYTFLTQANIFEGSAHRFWNVSA